MPRALRSAIITPVLALLALVVAGANAAAAAGAALPRTSVGPARHTVQAGETLTSIARAYGVSVDALAKANNISNRNRIVRGTTLVLPPTVALPVVPEARSWTVKIPVSVAPSHHVVARGDTWNSIARRWVTTPTQLAAANGRTTTSMLRAGEQLRLPSGAMALARLPDKLRTTPSRLALAPLFDKWARANDIPPDLFKAMAWMESGWQNTVISKAGAVGIGQLMPPTTKFINEYLIGGGARLDPKVPEDNIRLSARYLAYLLDLEDGDQVAALADYYQGAHSVNTIGPQAVTRNYVEVIMALKPRFATVA